MDKRKIVPLLIVAIALSRALYAEEGVVVKEKGVSFVAKENLTLRKSPPSGWFYATGETVGIIEKGTKVVATDEKRVKTLFGESRWLWLMGNVVDPKTGEKTSSGWVYAGETGGEFYFERTDVKEREESSGREK